MLKNVRTAACAAAALLALAHGAAEASSTTLAGRYAAFQRQWRASRPLLARTTSLLGLRTALAPATETVDRVLRHTVRLTAGEINPTNSPLFGSDFDARRPALDAHIGITASHCSATGDGVIVAVLDSGFNLQHPEIAARVLPYGFDPVGDDWNPQDRGNGVDDDGDGYPDAGVGHGTFVAGMVLAVAPDASILPVRIADDEGYGLEDELLAGIDFAIAMDADVVNLSFESATLSLGVRDKLRQARDAGIVVVVSAGNSGSEHLGVLASDGTTIAVGATDLDDRIAEFSNTPDDAGELALLAPGVYLHGPHGGPTNDACCYWSGTSFAAPLASGAAALALELSPGSSPAQVKDLLRAASTAPVTTSSGAAYAHAGRIDLLEVVGD